MTQKQLDTFQQKLTSIQKAELITSLDKKVQYLLVWWISEGKKYRLDFVFVIYNSTLLKRIEIDGYLRSYVLTALEKALKE